MKNMECGILQWNSWVGSDAQRIARAVEKISRDRPVDIIGFQEYTVRPGSDLRREIEAIGFVAANVVITRTDCDSSGAPLLQMGNAIFVQERHTVLASAFEWLRHAPERPPTHVDPTGPVIWGLPENRACLETVVALEGNSNATARMRTTQISFSPDDNRAREELARLRRIALTPGGLTGLPAHVEILAWDPNLRPDDPLMRPFDDGSLYINAGPDYAIPTWPTWTQELPGVTKPPLCDRIDYLFVGPPTTVLAAERVDLDDTPSDHLPLHGLLSIPLR